MVSLSVFLKGNNNCGNISPLLLRALVQADFWSLEQDRPIEISGSPIVGKIMSSTNLELCAAVNTKKEWDVTPNHSKAEFGNKQYLRWGIFGEGQALSRWSYSTIMRKRRFYRKKIGLIPRVASTQTYSSLANMSSYELSLAAGVWEQELRTTCCFRHSVLSESTCRTDQGSASDRDDARHGLFHYKTDCGEKNWTMREVHPEPGLREVRHRNCVSIYPRTYRACGQLHRTCSSRS